MATTAESDLRERLAKMLEQEAADLEAQFGGDIHDRLGRNYRQAADLVRRRRLPVDEG